MSCSFAVGGGVEHHKIYSSVVDRETDRQSLKRFKSWDEDGWRLINDNADGDDLQSE